MGNEIGHQSDPWEIPILYEASDGRQVRWLNSRNVSNALSNSVPPESVNNYIDLASNSPLAVVLTNPNPDFLIRTANKAFAHLTNQQQNALLVGQSLPRVIGCEVNTQFLSQLKGSSSSSSSSSSIKLFIASAGYHINVEACRSINGVIKCLLWTFRAKSKEIKTITTPKEKETNVNSTENTTPTTTPTPTTPTPTTPSTHNTPSILTPKGKKKGTKKTVQYNNRIRVILIPSRREYYERSLEKDLWHSREHLNSFAKNAINEIQEYMNTLKEALSVKQVMIELYQPEFGHNGTDTSTDGASTDGTYGTQDKYGINNTIASNQYDTYSFTVRFKRTTKTFVVDHQGHFNVSVAFSRWLGMDNNLALMSFTLYHPNFLAVLPSITSYRITFLPYCI